jgi:hypothetical protein
MLDPEQQATLRLMAGTLAQWLRDNREKYDEVDDEGKADANEYGMYQLATGFLRLYYECVEAGIIDPRSPNQPTVQ